MYEAQFCLNCGSSLTEALLPGEERPRLHCPQCGYIHYINPKVVCGVLPLEDGKVWLLRRGIEPRVGYWTHPAGFLEIDESTQEGALRETHEEIGCRVELGALLGVYSRPFAPVNVVYIGFVTARGGAPTTTVEATEVRAFSPEEIPWDEIAFPSTELALRAWLGLQSSL